MPSVLHTSLWRSAYLLAGIAMLFSSCGEDPEVRSYTAANHYEGPVVCWELPEQWGRKPWDVRNNGRFLSCKNFPGAKGAYWSDALSGICGNYPDRKYVCP